MKKIQALTMLLVVTVVLASLVMSSRVAGAPTHGAVTISFDDSNQSLFDYAWPAMQARGIVGTFYTVSSLIRDYSGDYLRMGLAELHTLQDAGNEIGSHSATHVHFEDLNDAQIAWECSESKQVLQSNGFSAVNFAFPYGDTNDPNAEHIDSIVSQYYRSGRSAYNDVRILTFPIDLFRLPGFPAETGDSSVLSLVESAIDQAYNENGWIQIYFHNVLPNVNDDPYTISSQDFATILDYIVAKGMPTYTVNQALDGGVGPLSVWASPTSVRMDVGESQTFISSVSGGVPPYSYQWYQNGGQVSGVTGSTWTFTPTQAGEYNVYTRVTDSLSTVVNSNIVTDIVVYPFSRAIMPLGDSITVGYPGVDGYRKDLYLNLINSGSNVDFVGSQHSGTGLDDDHEGHNGWEANAIRDNVYGWLEDNSADVVLLHIGTNDIYLEQDVADIVLEVESILDNIDQWEFVYGESVTVILARIILNFNDENLKLATMEYNDALEEMALARIATGDEIIIVDMENALIYPDDLIDGVHPTPAGYEKMADVWYNVLIKGQVDFPHGVITLSFDDNRKSQFTKVFPLLQERGMLSTFYIVTDWLDYSNTNTVVLTVGDLAALDAAGNEITSHTLSHANLVDLSDEQIREDLNSSKQVLQSLGFESDNFAYPFGSYDDRVENITKEFYRSARSTDWLMNPIDLPVEEFTFPGFTGETGDSYALENLREAVDIVRDSPNGWGHFFFHDVVDGVDNVEYSISTEDFTAFLDYIVLKNIPVMTVKQVLDYEPAPDQYTLNILSSTGGTPTPPPGSYTVNEETVFNVTETPNLGYVFSNWVIDGANAGTESTIHVSMNANHTLNAVFGLGPPPSVSISPTSVILTVDQSQLFSAVASGGAPPYTYKWVLNGLAVPNSNSSTLNFIPAEAGHYNIYVNLTDSNSFTAQSNIVSDIQVFYQLIVAINPASVKMYIGQLQTFSSSISGGTTPYSYQWYLNDTAMPGATTSTWSFTPNADGHYKVYLNVTDGFNFRAQSNVGDILACSVYLLLTANPIQDSYARGQTVAFTVNVFNQLDPVLGSSLALTVAGSGGYGYFDVQPINVPDGTVGEYRFNWVVPNVSGKYIVEVVLVPSLLTAYDTAWLIVT